MIVHMEQEHATCDQYSKYSNKRCLIILEEVAMKGETSLETNVSNFITL